ncbi:MAG: glycogen debranching enzyme family protein [Paludibacteraceae bacterium]|nr:glycogen debranching enzyme family protein [Paludibacteraceae bacterium]
MNYLNFDKTVLSNLEKSLTKEMIRTNRSGAYNSTTIVDCNTRKYHGQLVIPIPEIDGKNYVLLSSLDETIIQHKAEFNLGVHQYQGQQFSPNGHKYIREFSCEVISKTTYRVGGVIISKERLMVSYEPRIITKYTLIEAHSPTIIRFKPFLAFRSVHQLSHANGMANQGYEPVKNGIRCKLYEGYPYLYMQFNKQPEYHHEPYWYKGLEYEKEQERGYDYIEDLLVPGYFEMPIKKGESIYFTAGISEAAPRTLKSVWDRELAERIPRTDMFNCLNNAAQQFYRKSAEGEGLLAGYPWFGVQARAQFVSLPGATLCIGHPARFDRIMQTAIRETEKLFKGQNSDFIEELDAPDALLWCIWSLQQYAQFNGFDSLVAKYGAFVLDILKFINEQKHPNLYLHNNGLLFVNGRERPMTWMNAVEDGTPITPRTGYVVEINALWYNALCFGKDIAQAKGLTALVSDFEKQIATTGEAFFQTFWNGIYLYDYVHGTERNQEVRPNMIFAVSLPYSPLDKYQQKSVLDMCTRELLTTKGLRSLSPQSGSYRPNYVGGMKERNRNYHNGPVWPWTTGAYAEAYLKIHKQSGISFIDRLMIGMEAEMKKLSIGTLSELFDGNPPYKGHGAMSYAPTVAEILRTLTLLKNIENK